MGRNVYSVIQLLIKMRVPVEFNSKVTLNYLCFENLVFLRKYFNLQLLREKKSLVSFVFEINAPSQQTVQNPLTASSEGLHCPQQTKLAPSAH